MLDYLKKRSRFMVWLLVFFILLAFVPVLLVSEKTSLAKLCGIVMIILVSVALWRWRTQTVRKTTKAARIKMTLNERFWLERNIPFYAKLSKSEKIIFEDRIGLFLAEIQITEVGKDTPDKETCLYVASSAIIAYWGLPYWNYGDLSEVLVYPENFTDENLISRKGWIQGRVHHGGLMDSTMILSLRALKYGFGITNDGKNVGVHEFIHLLDKEDGLMDGVPFVFERDEKTIWFKLLRKEILKIRNNKSDFNSYGGTSEVEFFAVLMEYYREKPDILKRKHPQLYDFLISVFEKNED